MEEQARLEPEIKIIDEKILSELIERKSDSHKGDNGKVLVIGGSQHLVGAVALSAMACLRTGVDNVTVACPELCGYAINSMYPDIIVHKFKGDVLYYKYVKELLDLSNDFDVVLLGPGLGRDKNVVKLVQYFVRYCKKPMVIDADAIKALAGKTVQNAILTPHKAEFELFSNNTLTLDDAANGEILKEISGDNVILLKSKVDVIADKEKIAFNETGNSAMTVSGTGDVLAGLVAGLFAQTDKKFESACMAAYVNGKIGDLLFEEKKYGLIASDFISLIPNVIFK